jgi:hypothetical protein
VKPIANQRLADEANLPKGPAEHGNPPIVQNGAIADKWKGQRQKRQALLQQHRHAAYRVRYQQVSKRWILQPNFQCEDGPRNDRICAVDDRRIAEGDHAVCFLDFGHEPGQLVRLPDIVLISERETIIRRAALLDGCFEPKFESAESAATHCWTYCQDAIVTERLQLGFRNRIAPVNHDDESQGLILLG